MNIGDTFPSYKAFQEALKAYEDANFVNFWLRDCRTLRAAKKRCPQQVGDANEYLKYYECKLCCIHGGKTFKTTSEGQRNTKTFRSDCPAFIQLKLGSDKSVLEIVKTNCNHNHDVNKSLYRHLPRQRKLPEDVRQEAVKLLQLNANKRKIQQTLSTTTGKVILLKDLANIHQRINRKSEKNNLLKTVEKLQTEWQACVEILMDDDDNFKGLYFQDPEMKLSFASYPEFLFCDATHKLIGIDFQCYVLLVEDSNGESEVVGISLLVSEDLESITWFLETFKNHNPDHEKIRIIMADKDMQERKVFSLIFPQAQILICLFHTLQSFRREVTCEKLGITPGQRQYCLELFQKLAYAKSSQQYDELYAEFVEAAPTTVVEYFNANWNNIKDEWTMGMKFSSGNFLNNRLDSFDSKLKSGVSRHSSLESFVDQFFIILAALRRERDNKAALVLQKRPVQLFPPNSPSAQYQSFLTPYAFKMVQCQLDMSNKVKSTFKTLENGSYVVASTEGEVCVDQLSCSCCFQTSMKLPCQHVFAFRSQLNDPPFDECCCDKRWSLDYYKGVQRVFALSNANHDNTPVDIPSSSSKKKKVLSTFEKFQNVTNITNEIARVVANSAGLDYERNTELLKELLCYLKRNDEVALVSKTSSTPINSTET